MVSVLRELESAEQQHEEINFNVLMSVRDNLKS